jgi:succinate dehydrogenase (ubiquinone) flavoprotein subunit
LDKLRYANGDLPTADIRNKMQRLMQNNAAVFRPPEILEEGGRLFCFEVSNMLLRFV